MCGICGIVNLEGAAVSREALASMTVALRHRGPDGEGQLIDREAGLGHRRLSIIDVDGGAQPLGNEDGSVQVVANGEIYNYVELRDELRARGHAFTTSSDCEVIAHAYEEWGRDCVERFNGMFAFALWDAQRRAMLLARDHLGVKPLYWARVGPAVVFASEIKALLRYPGCARELDLESLTELFTFRYVPSPRTLFADVSKLPPGHRLTIAQGGLHIERYWAFIPPERRRTSEADLIEEYRVLLDDAVRLQLRSDVPVGLFLSSGIDSSALLALMRRHTGGRLRTFTVGFEGGDGTNEIRDACEIARRFDAEHQVAMISPDDYLTYYDRYMSDLEEPVGNETAAAFYFLARLTARHVKVALSGQGADEPWAGYDRHKAVKLSTVYCRLPARVTRAVEPLVARMPGRMERLQRGASSLAERDVLTRFARVYSFFSRDMKAALYRGSLRTAFEDDPDHPRHALARLHADVSHLDAVDQMLYIDTRASLPDDLLMVGDKTSMACSLEARVPYLDVRLVEFVESLPSSLKLHRLTGKYLHKKACRAWLPAHVVRRRKKGFANPVEHWLRGPMRRFVEDCLLDPSSGIRPYFDQQSVRRLLAMDRDGIAQYRRHIYLLLSFALWHRTFIAR